MTVPKRSDVRRRRNKPEGVQVVKARSGDDIVWPDAPESWTPLIVELYESLQVSGQAQFYEQSDVALARVVLDSLSVTTGSGRINGQLFSAAMSVLSNLLVTEGDRRRARIELERGGDLAEVTPIKNYRSAAAK
jgi:hypothetical protein